MVIGLTFTVLALKAEFTVGHSGKVKSLTITGGHTLKKCQVLAIN